MSYTRSIMEDFDGIKAELDRIKKEEEQNSKEPDNNNPTTCDQSWGECMAMGIYSPHEMSFYVKLLEELYPV